MSEKIVVCGGGGSLEPVPRKIGQQAQVHPRWDINVSQGTYCTCIQQTHCRRFRDTSWRRVSGLPAGSHASWGIRASPHQTKCEATALPFELPSNKPYVQTYLHPVANKTNSIKILHRHSLTNTHSNDTRPFSAPMHHFYTLHMSSDPCTDFIFTCHVSHFYYSSLQLPILLGLLHLALTQVLLVEMYCCHPVVHLWCYIPVLLMRLSVEALKRHLLTNYPVTSVQRCCRA